MKHPKPDPLLEFRALGEIPEALKSRADQDRQGADAADLLRDLRDSDRRILEEMPTNEMVTGIRRKLDATRRTANAATMSSWWRWAIVPALGLGVIVALLELSPDRDPAAMVAQHDDSLMPALAIPLDHQPPSIELNSVFLPRSRKDGGTEVDDRVALVEPADEGIRTKGDVSRLRVHLVDSAKLVATALGEGDTVDMGANLQVSLLAGPSLWAAVVSVDAAGTVTRHLPEQGDSAILVEGTIQAPHSFQLDASPGFERFVLVQSRRPFALSAIPGTLRDGKPGNGPHVVQSIRLVKREEIR